ncbi:uncharacterized protein LOC112590369 [Harpegnathos saltator]|uniref:uncharacterized protein LOC112590369 n=1 Tax=Harpegnathos saltator TaxID=610380 RepID=UPI000DBEE2B4|nr:uncharacterized protein LOC112590369 [Harpegnathos saltator]
MKAQKVNPKKCEFLRKKIKYLGHVISAEGVATDPDKISVLKDWPIPKTRKQVRKRDNLQEWHDFQLQDSVLAQIHQAKEIDKRPSWQAVAPMEISSKIYWSQWEAIVVLNGVLYKKWESPNLLNHVYQILVPREKVSEVLEEADSPSGGHFGINKTLQRIRKRFYWATCKRDVEDWCASCKICIAKKGPSEKGKSPLQVYNESGKLVLHLFILSQMDKLNVNIEQF